MKNKNEALKAKVGARDALIENANTYIDLLKEDIEKLKQQILALQSKLAQTMLDKDEKIADLKQQANRRIACQKLARIEEELEHWKLGAEIEAKEADRLREACSAKNISKVLDNWKQGLGMWDGENRLAQAIHNHIFPKKPQDKDKEAK